MTLQSTSDATGFAARSAEPIWLSGDPETRGRGHAAFGGADAAIVREATAGQVAIARAEGLIDADAEAFLVAQHAFHTAQTPPSLAELRGIAAGYGLSEDDLFAHLHLSLLRARKKIAERQRDGCSAWAVSNGPDGPMLVKNRDISGRNFGVQRVMMHEGADIETGSMLCVGSLGSPAAYSSGINEWGFTLADTHVEARASAVGWLRYFLMTRLLAECRSVNDALSTIRSVPHAGGGTLVLADRAGDLACVDFSGPGAAIATGSVVWRTNHYPDGNDPAPDARTDDDTIVNTSSGRFEFLAKSLPEKAWGAREAASLMATHRSPLVDGPLVCAHRDAGTSETLSCSIYTCRDGRLLFSDGNPCLGRWQTYQSKRQAEGGLQPEVRN